MTPEQVNRLIAAIESLAAANREWNAQQAQQWAADHAAVEEMKQAAAEQRAELQRQLGGVPIVGQGRFPG